MIRCIHDRELMLLLLLNDTRIEAGSVDGMPLHSVACRIPSKCQGCAASFGSGCEARFNQLFCGLPTFMCNQVSLIRMCGIAVYDDREHRELMLLLLLNDARIEADSVDGMPLHCVAFRGSVKAVQPLLVQGAKPDSTSVLCSFPLLCAIKSHSFSPQKKKKKVSLIRM